jgi:hypothetical protein
LTVLTFKGVLHEGASALVPEIAQEKNNIYGQFMNLLES